MPASPTTIACRAAAGRMTNFINLSGNAQIICKLVYEDSASINALRAIVTPATPPAGMVASLVLAAKRVSDVMECGGNLQLYPLLPASAPDVIAGCVFAEALP